MSEKISSFKDLRVYKLAFELQQQIFKISKRFPAEELYALTDQIRRASRSIGANLAEAWQKRRYIAHFISKLSDATENKQKLSIGCIQPPRAITCRKKSKGS